MGRRELLPRQADAPQDVNAFDPDRLVQGKRPLDEPEGSAAGFGDIDPRKLLRVLRILADQLELMRDA